MKNKLALLSGASLLVLLSVAGCGGGATPTPASTVAPREITVIVTATPPPATETSAAPTITPLPTVNTTETQAAVTLVKPTNTSVPPKPATRKPTAPRATATATSVPLTMPAPVLIRPNFDPGGTGQKDERHSPSDALIFEWQSIGPLAANVCYMIRVDLVPMNAPQPATGDAFLQCDSQWTQKAQAQTVQYVLYQPGHSGQTYSGLLPNPPTDVWVEWYVTVVADQGAGTGPQDPTGTRHKVVPLSPQSSTFKFILKGGGS
jgi:hypothetical protein